MIRAGAGVLLLSALLAGSAPARAYVRTTTETNQAMRWPSPYLSVDLYTGNPPAYLAEETLVSATRAAAATWSNPTVDCTDMQISVRAVDDESAPVAYDGVNRITFRREEWRKFPCDPGTELCGLYDSKAIALTSVFARKSDGRILDSDMELNAVNFVWADVVRDGRDLPNMERQLHDLQNVLTHELGHLIGMDHNCYDAGANPRGRPDDHEGNPVPNCDGASAPIRAATMYNSAGMRDVSKRDLTDDDIRAVCGVYPIGSGEGEPAGCTAGGRTPTQGRAPGALPLLAGALALTFLRRRRR
jgi:hypothetical protein